LVTPQSAEAWPEFTGRVAVEHVQDASPKSAARLGSAADVTKARLSALERACDMKFTKSGHYLADLKFGDAYKLALAMLVWPAISALTILASATFAFSGIKATKAGSTLEYRCEYSDKSLQREERVWNFYFDTGLPYDFIDMVAFGHTIRTTVVTDDQVVEQRMSFENANQPDRLTAISFIVLNRRDLSIRRHTERVDLKTRERTIESDRSGVCALATGRKAR
jgi:hypothetical protein